MTARGLLTFFIIASVLPVVPVHPAAADFVSDHLAGPPVRVHGTGSPSTLNIVILGDGFTADNDSMGAYRDAAAQVVTELLAADPFQALSSALTIYRVDVISDSAGIDVPRECGGHPYDTPPMSDGSPFPWSRSEKDPRNSLETHWCATSITGQSRKQLLNSESTRVSDFALASGVAPDMTIVLVNDWMFGATAWSTPGVVFVSIGRNLVGDINPDTGNLLEPNVPEAFPGVVVHEIGHLDPFLLLDEYSKGRNQDDLPAVTTIIEESANLTTTFEPLKWSSLVAPQTKLPTACTPTDSPEVGAVDGGYEFNEGVYHSRCQCRMNNHYDASFCVVCRDHLLKELAPHVPLLGYRPPRREPPPLWVILDSVQSKSIPSGRFTIDYVVSMGTRRIAGTWPPSSSAALLRRGQTAEIGDLIAVLPASPTSPAAADTLAISYKLNWSPRNMTAGRPTVVATERWEVPYARVRTGLVTVPVSRATHRLTIGLVVPRH